MEFVLDLLGNYGVPVAVAAACFWQLREQRRELVAEMKAQREAHALETSALKEAVDRLALSINSVAARNNDRT